MRRLPVQFRDEVIEALPRRIAAAIKLLQGYPISSVGAWLDALAASLPAVWYEKLAGTTWAAAAAAQQNARLEGLRQGREEMARHERQQRAAGGATS